MEGGDKSWREWEGSVEYKEKCEEVIADQGIFDSN